MKIYEIYTNDSEALKIARISFPEFNGKTVEVEEFNGPMRLDSYWSEGNRDFYAIVNLSNNRSKQIPENGGMFSGKTFKISKLPSNFAVVNYHIGMVKYIKIYVNKENLTKMLPTSTDELTWEEKVVLVATRSLKSSYAGIPNYRMYSAKRQTGITEQEYIEAKNNLIKNGYLNAAGALTIKGKNAASFDQFPDLLFLKNNKK